MWMPTFFNPAPSSSDAGGDASAGGSWGADTELTLDGGAVTPTGHNHKIDTESDAAVDYLDTIDLTNLEDGDVLTLQPADSGRTVWVTDDDNIVTPDALYYPIPHETGAQFIVDGDNVKLTACGKWGLTENHSLSWAVDSTADEKRAAIGKIPCDLGSRTLTITLATGTHTTSMDDGLDFSNFHNGKIILQGNTGDTTPYNPGTTDPTVILEWDAGVTRDMLYFRKCNCEILVRNFRLKAPGLSDWRKMMHISQCRYVTVEDCVFELPSSDAYACLFENGSVGEVTDCWFKCGFAGIAAGGPGVFVLSKDNEDFTTKPDYGLSAFTGGVIAKYNSTTVLEGAISDDNDYRGGKIWQP